MARAPKIKATVRGLPAVQRSLLALDDKIRARIIRKAVAAAAKKLTARLKAVVPVETGATRKAIGQRITLRKAEGWAGALVGVRRRMRFASIATTAAGKTRRKTVRVKAGDSADNLRVPTKYFHLIGGRELAAQVIAQSADADEIMLDAVGVELAKAAREVAK